MAEARFGLSNPIREYKWAKLILAAPISLFFEVWLTLLSLLYRKLPIKGFDQVPKDAIIYAFHSDIYCTAMTMKQLRPIFENGGSYLGSHTFVSYLWAAGCVLRGARSFRFSKSKTGKRTLDLIIDYLNARKTGRFFIRTDSGGPYGKVRKSVIELSLRTGRPVVAIRQIASKHYLLRSHQIPIPFCEISTVFSKPIFPQELKSETEALALLQARIDQLV